VPAFRRALDAWLIDGRVADSVLERTMNRLLHRHALPPAQFHAVIAGYEVDFWIIGTPIVLECDGWATHGRDRRQFERDRQRDAELTGLGYITVRFTYARLVRQPQWVVDKVRRALARWAPGPLAH
jgi:very-short-patch-repair endonuclease